MSQGLSLARRPCARNAGVGLVLRALLSSFVLFALNTLFAVPGETTLTAAKRVKATGWVFLLVLCAIFIMTFCSLVIAFAGNNVFTTVNKDLSLGAAALRLIEAFLFIISKMMNRQPVKS